MPNLEGKLIASDRKFAIVVSRFNDLVTDRLLDGARGGLLRHGVKDDAITVVKVPGACEIPQVARKLAMSGKFAAVITLGCVIRGATPHFDQVVATVTRGVADAANAGNIPVIFGVLTTENLEQALDRAGAKVGNKGFDAAVAAIEMADLWPQLP